MSPTKRAHEFSKMMMGSVKDGDQTREPRWLSFLLVGACLGSVDGVKLLLEGDLGGALVCLSTATLLSLGFGALGSLLWTGTAILEWQFPKTSAGLARLAPGIAPLTLALSAAALTRDPLALLLSLLPLGIAVATGTLPQHKYGGFGYWMLLLSAFNLWLWEDLHWIAKLATQSTQLAALACALTYVACLLAAHGCRAVLGGLPRARRLQKAEALTFLFGVAGFASLLHFLSSYEILQHLAALCAWLALLPLASRLSAFLEARVRPIWGRFAKLALTAGAMSVVATATVTLLRTGTSPVAGTSGGQWIGALYAHVLSPEQRLARFKETLEASGPTSPFHLAAIRPQPPVIPSPETIVLLTVDALRADRVRTIASPSFLKESWNFTRTYAPSSSTLLSLPALLASQYPSQLDWKLGTTDSEHRIYDSPLESPERVWSWPILARRPEGQLAVLLSEMGFYTHAILSGGYTHFFDSQAGFEDGFRSHVLLGGDDHLENQGRPSADEQAVLAFDSFLGEHESKPLFIWLHLFGPHFPYPDDVTCTRAVPYDCDVETSAQNVARVFSSLRRSGRYERAVIVLSSDHGHSLGDNGVGSPQSGKHAVGVYDAQIRVPLLLRLPGGAGGTTDALASTLDIAPTLLAIFGAKPHRLHVGVDLRSLALGAARPMPVFFEQWQLKPAGNSFAERWVGAVSNQTKVFLDEQRGRLFEFSLDEDPREARNLLSPGTFAPTPEGTHLLRAVLSFRQATADNPLNLPHLIE